MKINRDMLGLMHGYLLEQLSQRYHLYFMSGPRLPKSVIAPTPAAYAWTMTYSTFNNAVVAAGGQVLGYSQIDKSAFPALTSGPAGTLKYRYGQVPFIPLASGIATWFLAVGRTTTIEYNQNGYAVFGFTGDISSYAVGTGDMLVNDPTISLGDVRKIIDISIGVS